MIISMTLWRLKEQYVSTPPQYSPTENFIIEDYASFLNNYYEVVFTDTNFRNMTLDLDMSIKVPAAYYPVAFGGNNDSSSSQSTYGLVSFHVQDSNLKFVKTYYYFIVSSSRKSENTIALNLRLDTLNTIGPGLLETGIGSFHSDSFVEREHRDRWKFSEVFGYYAKIDKQPENITAPLFPVTRTKLEDDNEILRDNDCMLVYKARSGLSPDDLENALGCYIAFEKGVPAEGTDGGIGVSELELPAQNENAYRRYYFRRWMNPNLKSFHLGNKDVKVDQNATWDVLFLTLITTLQTGIVQTKWYLTYSVDNGSAFGFIKEEEGIWFLSSSPGGPTVTGCNYYAVTSGVLDLFYNPKTDNPDVYQHFTALSFPDGFEDVGVGGLTAVASVGQVNRYDSRNVKIVSCPYSPAEVTLGSEGEGLIDGFAIDSNTGLAIAGNPSEFNPRKVKEIGMDLKPYLTNSKWNDIKTSYETDSRIARDDSFEPKQYNSDFFSMEYVYDTFSWRMYLEYLEYGESDGRSTPSESARDNLHLPLYYEQGAAVSSKFSILVGAMPTDGGTIKLMKTEGRLVTGFRIKSAWFDYVPPIDFPLSCVCGRNNEEPIFTYDYINYIRNGYNYDVKKNERATTRESIGVLESAAGLGVTYKASRAENASTTAPFFVAQRAGSLAANIYSVIVNNVQRDENLNRKLQQSAMTRIGVSGSDDLDLFRTITDNKVWLVISRPSEITLDSILDLFHYCGYATGERKKPIAHTRTHFNYLKGEMNFEGELLIGATMTNDLKAKFREGVTYIWKNTSNGENYWDTERECINLETSLVVN